jgi:CheY-like chemotaxis protein
MAKVLCVGMNDAAMQTRQMLLEQAGHSVAIARDLRQIIAACEREQFSVAVLGQHLPAKEKLRITGKVRELCPGARILELQATLSTPIPTADAHLTASEEAFAEELIDCVNRLATRKRKRAAKR